MPIHTVFFDVGETLLDETRIWGAWADWLGVTRLTFFAALGAVIARGGLAGPLGSGGIRGGVELVYGYQNYSFDNPVAFGGLAPWGIIQRFGVSVPLSLPLSNGWSLGFTPSADWFRENGASTDDALAWGALLTGVKRFENGNMIGLGVGAYDRIEETALFPFDPTTWHTGELTIDGPANQAAMNIDQSMVQAIDMPGIGEQAAMGPPQFEIGLGIAGTHDTCEFLYDEITIEPLP